MEGRRDELSYTERAVIESIRRGEPDAYIAQGLGISILEVKSAVDRLMARYGKSERAGLATVPLDGDAPGGWEALPSRGSGDELSDEAVTPGVAPLPLERGDDEPVYSRRAVLGMIGVGAATLAGIGAYYLTGRSDSTAPARPDPFATNTPTPAATPPPTPTPHPGLGAIEPAPDAWVRRTFVNGQPLDMEHGIGFVNTATGETEAFQLAEGYGHVSGGNEYEVSASNDVVVVTRRWWSVAPGLRGALLRRSTGESIAWPADSMELVAFTDEVLVFHRKARLEGRNTGIFDVVDTSMRSISQFQLPRHGQGPQQYPVVMSKSGRYLASVIGAEIHIVELASGRVDAHDMPKVDGASPVRTWIRESEEPDGFILGGYVLEDGVGDRYLEVRIGSAGEVTSTVEGDTWGWPISPDGRYRTWWGTLRQAYPHAAAALQVSGYAYEEWSYTELRDAETNESLFRVLSGNRSGGRHWLADSSGFVVDARPQEPPLDHFEEWVFSRGAYLVGIDGSMEELRPDLAERRPLHPGFTGLEPSPDDPNIFSVGGALIWNREQNRILGPGDVWPAETIQPWGDSGSEVRFTFPREGDVYPGGNTVLPPRVERPPYRDDVTLQVARAGTCVYQRGSPSLDGEVLDCLPDGTRLTRVPPPEPPYPGTPVPENEPIAFFGARTDGELQMFVHVRTDHGRTGWVAIQYLDWAE